MKPRPTPIPAPLRAWAALLTLLLVLVCAAPMGGVPGSRTVGSAFDPATAAVSLRPPKPAVLAQQGQAERPDKAPPLLPQAAVPPAAEVLRLRATAGPAVPAALDAAPAVPDHRFLPLGARAPPAA